MYMKNRLTFVVAAAILGYTFGTACKQPGGSNAKRAEAAAAAAQDRDAKAVAIIKDFYTAYMYQFAAAPGPNSQERLDSIASQYCSGDMINEIHKTALEADPFLHAQDCDSAWVKTLLVVKDSVKQNTYNISYHTGGTNSEMVVIHAEISQGDDGVLIENIY